MDLFLVLSMFHMSLMVNIWLSRSREEVLPEHASRKCCQNRRREISHFLSRLGKNNPWRRERNVRFSGCICFVSYTFPVSLPFLCASPLNGDFFRSRWNSTVAKRCFVPERKLEVFEELFPANSLHNLLQWSKVLLCCGQIRSEWCIHNAIVARVEKGSEYWKCN